MEIIITYLVTPIAVLLWGFVVPITLIVIAVKLSDIHRIMKVPVGPIEPLWGTGLVSKQINTEIEPVMYEWPESQICMNCKHGEFIMSDALVNSDHLCMIGCGENDGVDCPGFEQENEEQEGRSA